jgi:hypothetical protein
MTCDEAAGQVRELDALRTALACQLERFAQEFDQVEEDAVRREDQAPTKIL